MEDLLHLGFSNAVAAAVLALIAAAATFLLRRRPALVHGLWLLVLLKLFTPPLVRLPVPWVADTPLPGPVAASSPAGSVDVAPEEPPAIAILRLPEENAGAEADTGVRGGVAPLELGELPAAAEERPTAPPRADSAAALGTPVPATGPDWMAVAGMVWAAGSVCWFVIAAGRVLRFRRLLRYAETAPAELRDRVARLARRLGLARYPRVLLMPGRLAPMLWAAGGTPRLLVPAGLLGQVRNDQLDTLILHELAHLRRRDHWVRGLELLAMGLFWWNPVVWWARHELREAEEQCCDAWVVSVLSGSRRAYAEALVETLDFLSPAVPVQPLLSSGIGHVSDLKRRLTMILSGTTPRAMTWRGALTVLGLACALPLFPAWVRAQAPPPDDEKKVIQFRLIQLADEEEAADPDGAKKDAELKALEAQLAQKLAELKVLEQKLNAIKGKAKTSEAGWKIIEKAKTPEGAWKVVAADEKGKMILWSDDKDAAGRKALVGEKRAVVVWADAKAPGQPAFPQPGALYEIVPGEKGSWILRPVTPGRMSARDAVRYRVVETAPRRGVRVEVPGVGEASSREKELEKRLDALMRELEQLRRDMKKPTGPGRPPRGPEEQGKIEVGPPGTELRLIQDDKKADVKDVEARRRVVELHVKADRFKEQLMAAAADHKSAVAEAEHARLTLEKIREVAVPEHPQIKVAAERLEAARARLKQVEKMLIDLKVRADEAAKEAERSGR
jgi:beta-lactamase regulating signal transducer with metallopeptidase domain